MATWEEIKTANDQMVATDIKGAPYMQVNQRIKAFRMVYPNGGIITEMLSNDEGVCVFKATITDGEKILATGTAYEKEGSTFINKTSYIENCETSACGRALGMAGFGIDTSVASYEEVKNAMLNQDLITQAQMNVIKSKYVGEKMEKLLEWAKVTKLEDMTAAQATQVIKQIKAREEKK